MGINPTDAKCVPFYCKMKELGMVSGGKTSHGLYVQLITAYSCVHFLMPTLTRLVFVLLILWCRLCWYILGKNTL